MTPPPLRGHRSQYIPLRFLSILPIDADSTHPRGVFQNQFSGAIPPQLSQLDRLKFLLVQQNDLTSFPSSICDLFNSSVGRLDAGACDATRNPLRCPIPECARTGCNDAVCK